MSISNLNSTKSNTVKCDNLDANDITTETLIATTATLTNVNISNFVATNITATTGNITNLTSDSISSSTMDSGYLSVENFACEGADIHSILSESLIVTTISSPYLYSQRGIVNVSATNLTVPNFNCVYNLIVIDKIAIVDMQATSLLTSTGNPITLLFLSPFSLQSNFSANNQVIGLVTPLGQPPVAISGIIATKQLTAQIDVSPSGGFNLSFHFSISSVV